MTLLYPLTTEKAIKAIEAENKITFVVEKKATKPEIAKELQENFKVKIISINLQIKGNKKIAIAKLKAETPAIDVATRLGII